MFGVGEDVVPLPLVWFARSASFGVEAVACWLLVAEPLDAADAVVVCVGEAVVCGGANVVVAAVAGATVGLLLVCCCCVAVENVVSVGAVVVVEVPIERPVDFGRAAPAVVEVVAAPSAGGAFGRLVVDCWAGRVTVVAATTRPFVCCCCGTFAVVIVCCGTLRPDGAAAVVRPPGAPAAVVGCICAGKLFIIIM